MKPKVINEVVQTWCPRGLGKKDREELVDNLFENALTEELCDPLKEDMRRTSKNVIYRITIIKELL